MRKPFKTIVDILQVALFIWLCSSPIDSAYETAFIGNFFRAGRAKKNIKELKKERMPLDERIASLQQYQPQLQIDRSGFSNAVGLNKGNIKGVQDDLVTAQSGRVAGEDQAREAVRSTFANSLTAARDASSSSTDLLNAGASLQAGANEAMRGIDAQSAQIRDSNIRFNQGRLDNANARLGSSLSDEASFNYQADLNEFENNEQFAYMQALQDERALKNAIRAAKNAKAEANAGIADGALDTGMSIFSTLVGGGAMPTGGKA